MMSRRLGDLLLAAALWTCSLARAAQPLGEDAAPVGDAGQTVHGTGVLQASATPILLSVLKQLRSESEKSSAQGTAWAQWCRDARNDESGLAEVLRRQRGEASNAARSLGLESRRLDSEERLANLTIGEQEQRLSGAFAVANFAAGEFAGEQQQARAAIDAARRAIGLARSPGVVPREAAPSEASGSFDERFGAEHEALGPTSTQEDLLRSLRRLEGGMEAEQASAREEQGALLKKFTAFADHLDSSMLETRSQAAAFTTEAAQRRREQERLDGRLSDLGALLEAVQAAAKATAGACDGEAVRKRDLAAAVSEESRRVSALLKQLRGADSSGEGEVSPLGPIRDEVAAITGSGAGRGDAESSPPSLLQAASQHKVQGRHSAAMRGGRAAQPEEGDEDGGEALGELLSSAPEEQGSSEDGPRNGPGAGAMQDIKQFVTLDADAAEQEGSRDTPSSALQDIKQFVLSTADSDSEASTARTSERRRERERELALSRARAAERQRVCTSIQGEGQKDSVALSRSLDRANAKLSINRAASSEYAQASEYLRGQQKQTEARLERLATLAKGTESWVTGSRPLLQGHAEQLMALATELNEQLGTEEEGVAQAIRELAQRIDGHQGALQRYADAFRGAKGSAEAATRALAHRLAEDSQASKRRFARLQAEGKVLTSLANAKAGARALSSRYQATVGQLCSKESIEKLSE